MRIRIAICLCLTLMGSRLLPQTAEQEQILEFSTEAEEDLPDYLDEALRQPADLNAVSLQELVQFERLTSEQCRHIIRTRGKKRFLSWQDFQHRTGLDQDIIDWMKYFFQIVPVAAPEIHPFQFRQRGRIFRKFPESRGFETEAYAGSPWKLYEQFRFTSGARIEGGILFEKDPGETRWNDHQAGFLSIQACPQAQVIIGNYQVQTGQGLTTWGPYAPMKGTAPLAGFSGRTQPVRGYLCADETQAMQGAAAVIQFKAWHLSGYLSESKRDADRDSVIYSFPASGLHRTGSELVKRHTVREKTAGGRFGFTSLYGAIGLSFWKNRYSLPVTSRDLIRQRFAFKGTENHAIGLDWYSGVRSCRFSGEIARSALGYSWLTRLSCQTGLWKGLILGRFYSPDFNNPHAKGFGSGEAGNETGIYLGSQVKISRCCRLTLYQDISSSVWRTYQLPVPQRKSDWFAQLNITALKHCELWISWRRQSQENACTGITMNGRTIASVMKEMKNRVRFEMLLQPGSQWFLKFRFETIAMFHPFLTGEISMPSLRENGFLMLQDVRYLTPDQRLDVRLRWICYQTDSWDSRIYLYENDLPGRMTNTFHYGRGNRGYLLVTWKPGSAVNLSVKYGVTFHDGAACWGSGLDEITGDTVKDLGIQLDIRR